MSYIPHFSGVISRDFPTAIRAVGKARYNVTFKEAREPGRWKRVPLEVLEDEDSPELEALVEKARQELDRR